MGKPDVVIKIDDSKKCLKCHKKGATQNGLCLTCIGEKITTMHLSNWPDDGEAFREATEVTAIAGQIMVECPEMNWLTDANVYYQFQETMTGPVIGNCSRVPKRFRLWELANVHYVITIDWTAWRELDSENRRRLVYHELKHIGKNEDGKWTCTRHDFEGYVGEWVMFQGIIAKDIHLGKIFKQAELELVPGEEKNG